jgi:hypothetical protein
MDVAPSYDLPSDNTPVIAAISTEVVIKKTLPGTITEKPTGPTIKQKSKKPIIYTPVLKALKNLTQPRLILLAFLKKQLYKPLQF